MEMSLNLQVYVKEIKKKKVPCFSHLFQILTLSATLNKSS